MWIYIDRETLFPRPLSKGMARQIKTVPLDYVLRAIWSHS